MEEQVLVGLRVRVCPDPSAERWSLGDFLGRSLLACVLFVGFMGTFAGGFPSARIDAWAWVSLGCAMAVAAALLYSTALRGRAFAGGVLATAVYCLLLFGQIKSGLGLLANDFLDFLTVKTGRIFLHYDTGAADAGALFLALIPIFALLALQLGAAVRYSDVWLLIPPALAVAAGCVSGFLPAGGALVLAGAGVCWLLVRRTQTGNDGVMLEGSLPAVLIALALSAAVAAVLALPLAGSASELSASGRDWLSETVHRLRYDSASASMPEGDLAHASTWEKNDTVALTVEMQRPQKLYLRGMIGETYTGTSWEPLSGDTQAEYKDLFYWLHREGFYGQSGIASAGLLTEEGPEIASVRIDNLAACKERMYLPYAVCKSDLFDELRIGDATYAGEDGYSFKMLTGSVPDWYLYQSALSDAQAEGDPAALAFLDDERAYRDYVYENYLSITDEACEALVAALGTETDELSLEEIKGRIRDFLDEKMTYGEKSSSRSGKADFLAYTLRKGRGYSVHYATAAALTLRYYGVPARYVEGYFLPKTEAAGYAPGEIIRLDENHAHAWAEYYLDGVGWIPFEVTPGYLDDEEIELETVFDENSPYYQSGAKSYSRSYVGRHRPSPEITQPEDTRDSAGGAAAAMLKKGLLWLLPAASLLLFLWIIRGRIRLRRSLRRIAALPEPEAVAAWFGYAMALMRLAGFRGTPETERFPMVMARWAGEPAGLYQKIYENNLEARFGKTAAPGRRDLMEEFARATVGLCRNRWTYPQRIYYRWINCWYL